MLRFNRNCVIKTKKHLTKSDNQRKDLRSRMKETINEFLKFRSQFTKREWFEINQAVEARLNEKADQLKLDDSDVEIISKRLEKVI